MAVALDSRKRPAVRPDEQDPAPAPSEEYLCRWDGCGIDFASGEQLYEHLCTDHVIRRPKHYGAGAQPVGDATRRPAGPHTPNTSVMSNTGEPQTVDQGRLYCHWKNCRVTVQKRDHMTSHIRIHINMKPYSCPQCDKKFKRTQDLKKHLRTHPEERSKARTKTVASAAVSAAAAKRTALPAVVPVARAKKRRPEVGVKDAAKRARPHTEQQQQQQQLKKLIEISSMRVSDPEKQRAVAASLTLLADVHSSQVKPEFNESLAERLDEVSLILKDENLLQYVSDSVTRSNINTSEHLGELDEFLEQVSESISEQQMSIRMKQEEQPFSEIVYANMKPVFPPLPFEPGTEADFLSGPNYFTDVFDSAQNVPQRMEHFRGQQPQLSMHGDREHGHHEHGHAGALALHGSPGSDSVHGGLVSDDSISQSQAAQGQAVQNQATQSQTVQNQAIQNQAAQHERLAREYAQQSSMSHHRSICHEHVSGSGDLSEQPSAQVDSPYERFYKETPEFWSNAPLLEAPGTTEESDVPDVLDYYLNQMETQMTVEHTLEVTSGLRSLISDAMEPDMQASLTPTSQYEYPKMNVCQSDEYSDINYQWPRHSAAPYAFPSPNYHEQFTQQPVYQERRTDMRF